MKRQEGNLNAYYSVEEVKWKRLGSILFQLYVILEDAK
jgi:hypothetical protein